MDVASAPGRALDHTTAAPDWSDSHARMLKTITMVLVLAGIGCRLRQYLARASFFSDEASIILNLRNHSFRELAGRLDHAQAAPPLFLWAEKALYLRFGPNEYALRAIPLSAGIVSLAVFAVLSWRVLAPVMATCVVAWFAFCEKLIDYCSELKQYSGDVLIALLLLYLLLAWRRSASARSRLVLIAAVSAIALWFSHTTIILFAAFSLLLSIQCLRAGHRATLAAIGANLAVAASFVALYLFSIHRQHQDRLYEFWMDGFPNFAHPLSLPKWLARQTYELCGTPFRSSGLVVLALTTLGTFALSRKRRWLLLGACLLPIGLTLLAAVARQYPYNGSRLTMFLFPGLFLLAAAGAQMLWQNRAIAFRVLALLLMLVPATMGAVAAGARVGSPRFLSHIRPVVQYVREHRKRGEAMYLLSELNQTNDGPLVAVSNHVELLAYWPDPDPPIHMQLASVSDIHEKRFWIVMAVRPQRIGDIRKLLDDVSVVAEPQGKPFIVKQGAGACLFELRQPASQPARERPR